MPSGPTGRDLIPLEHLLQELDASPTDLARLVRAVARGRAPAIVVPARAVTEWKRRAPRAWSTASAWLAAQGVTIVEV